jgi:hypothetical protein
MTELDTELGTQEPLPIKALSEGEQAALLELVREMRARRATELQTAISNALDQVPRVLRGALRKVLF